MLRRAGLIDSLPDISRKFRFDGARRKAPLVAAAPYSEAAGVSLPVVGVSPGAAYGSAKRWLPGALCRSRGRPARRAAEHGRGLWLGCGGGYCASPSRGNQRRAKLRRSDQPARRSSTWRRPATLFLTNDSGAMHIAAAAGVPSVTVFGPTDEFATGPTGETSVLLREPVECAPCLKRECPIDHRCMTRVTVDRRWSTRRKASKSP